MKNLRLLFLVFTITFNYPSCIEGKHKPEHHAKGRHQARASHALSKKQFIPSIYNGFRRSKAPKRCDPSCQHFCTPDCDFACCIPAPPKPATRRREQCASYCPRSCYPQCKPSCCNVRRSSAYRSHLPTHFGYVRPFPALVQTASFSESTPPSCPANCPSYCYPTCSYSCCSPRAASLRNSLPIRRTEDPFRRFQGLQSSFRAVVPQYAPAGMAIGQRRCPEPCARDCFPTCTPACCQLPAQQTYSQQPYQSYAPLPPAGQSAFIPPSPMSEGSRISKVILPHLPPPASCPASCPAQCAPICSPFCCSEAQPPPPPPSPPSEGPSCPGSCAQSCYPQCTPSCCMTQPPQFPQGAPVSVQIPPQSTPPQSTPLSCPGSCSLSCFPQCTSSCCLQNQLQSPLPPALPPAPPPAAPLIVLIPRPPPVCPAPCPPSCYPQCDKACCCMKSKRKRKRSIQKVQSHHKRSLEEELDRRANIGMCATDR